MLYVEQHHHNPSIQLSDALIAATAVAHGEFLVTGNVNDYKILKEINLT